MILWLWFEHFVILPLRWWRVHIDNWRHQRQRCKVCGCADGFNFQAPQHVWDTVVPEKYRTRVVCLSCFDRFAKEIGTHYAGLLSEIWFAGDRTTMKFRVVRAIRNVD